MKWIMLSKNCWEAVALRVAAWLAIVANLASVRGRRVLSPRHGKTARLRQGIRLIVFSHCRQMLRETFPGLLEDALVPPQVGVGELQSLDRRLEGCAVDDLGQLSQRPTAFEGMKTHLSSMSVFRG